jgi:hypothetical protein
MESDIALKLRFLLNEGVMSMLYRLGVIVLHHKREAVLFAEPLLIEDVEVDSGLSSAAEQLCLQFRMNLVDLNRRGANVFGLL